MLYFPDKIGDGDTLISIIDNSWTVPIFWEFDLYGISSVQINEAGLYI